MMATRDAIRVEELPPRRFAVRRHDGPLDAIEQTRRPLYQHLILNEFVGGSPVLRFHDDGAVDVLVGTVSGFDGDDVAPVEVVPAGSYAVADYEGPADDLAAARSAFLDAVRAAGHTPSGPLLQVHVMDELDGETEQQFQVPLAS